MAYLPWGSTWCSPEVLVIKYINTAEAKKSSIVCIVPLFCCLSGVVYLQYGDEIKRAMLPAGMEGLQQVQTLFHETFSDKIKNNDNRKTIYIKDNSCGVFYELDNVR